MARSKKRNPIKRFFSLLGPGLITGASDNDPSGIADCQAPKEYLFPARFGWLLVGTFLAGKKKRKNYSSACSICAMISDFSPKSTIRAKSVS